jgi:carbonic anhydrase
MAPIENLTPEDALKRLQNGNARFADERAKRPRADGARRAEVEAGQHPFATILTCGDSRVSPTLMFDQGLGDLFVLRVAGNIHGNSVIASIEYAAVHLSVRLVLVVGHSSCGAVTATVERVSGGHLEALAAVIRPAVERAREQPGDLIDNAIRENARGVADTLRTNQPILAGLAADGTIEVHAAYYDLSTGRVELI